MVVHMRLNEGACLEEGCTKNAGFRGLCHSHYVKKWRAVELPPKRQRPPKLIMLRVFVSREQLARLTEYADERSLQMSTTVRDIIVRFLDALERQKQKQVAATQEKPY